MVNSYLAATGEADPEIEELDPEIPGTMDTPPSTPLNRCPELAREAAAEKEEETEEREDEEAAEEERGGVGQGGGRDAACERGRRCGT